MRNYIYSTFLYLLTALTFYSGLYGQNRSSVNAGLASSNDVKCMTGSYGLQDLECLKENIPFDRNTFHYNDSAVYAEQELLFLATFQDGAEKWMKYSMQMGSIEEINIDDYYYQNGRQQVYGDKEQITLKGRNIVYQGSEYAIFEPSADITAPTMRADYLSEVNEPMLNLIPLGFSFDYSRILFSNDFGGLAVEYRIWSLDIETGILDELPLDPYMHSNLNTVYSPISPNQRYIAYGVNQASLNFDEPPVRGKQIKIYDLKVDATVLVDVGPDILHISQLRWQIKNPNFQVRAGVGPGLKFPVEGEWRCTRNWTSSTAPITYPNRANCNCLSNGSSCDGHGYIAIDFSNSHINSSPDHAYILAPIDCKVADTKWASTTGNEVVLEFYDQGQKYMMRILHLSAIYVQKDDWLSTGDLIGKEGGTGNSTGEHIHFDYYKDYAASINRLEPRFEETPNGNNPGTPCEEDSHNSNNTISSTPISEEIDIVGIHDFGTHGVNFSASLSAQQSNESVLINGVSEPRARVTSYGYSSTKWYAGTEKIYKITLLVSGELDIEIKNFFCTNATGKKHIGGGNFQSCSQGGWHPDLDVILLETTNPDDVLGTRNASNDRITTTSLQPGTYYIVIDGAKYNGVEGNVGQFDIDVTYTPDPIPTCHDPNENASNYTVISQYSSLHPSQSEPLFSIQGCMDNTDVDQFGVTINGALFAKGNLKAELQWDETQGDMHVALRKKSNHALKESGQLVSPGFMELNFCEKIVFSTDYYIEVTGSNLSVGSHSYSLKVKWFGQCSSSSSRTSFTAGADKTSCVGTSINFSDAQAPNPTSVFWFPPDGLDNPFTLHPNASPTQSTTYYLIDTIGANCAFIDELQVNVQPPPTANAGTDKTIYYGGSTQLQGLGGGSYSWSPTIGLSNPNISNPIASPTQTTIYELTVTDPATNCTDKDYVTVNVNGSSGGVSVSNDNACNATSLQVGTSLNYQTASNVGATNSNVGTPYGCASTSTSQNPSAGYAGGDVWFTFVVPSNGDALISTIIQSNVTDLALAVYTGSCTNLTQIACMDDLVPGSNFMPSIYLTNLNPGNTVYVRVWEFNNDRAGTFGIAIGTLGNVGGGGGGNTNLPDLTTTIHSVSDQNPDQGDNITVNWSIQNNGTAVSSTFISSMFVSSDQLFDASSDVVVPGSGVLLNSLSSGGSQTQSFSFSIPSSLTDGSYYILAETDGLLNNISESNEGNNVYAYPITIGNVVVHGPNLEIDNEYLTLPDGSPLPSGGLAPGMQIEAHCQVENNGDRDTDYNGGSGSSYVLYVLSDDNDYDPNEDIILDDDYVSQLDDGDDSNESQTLTLPPYPQIGSGWSTGTWRILFIADGYNEVVETDEDDNDEDQPFYVYTTTPAAPDYTLVIDSLWQEGVKVSPDSLLPDKEIDVWYTVTNGGNLDGDWSKNPRARLFLSDDITASPLDLRLGWDRHSGIEVDSSYREGEDHSFRGVDLGPHYIIVEANANRDEVESNYFNNTDVFPVNIIDGGNPLPDLTIEMVSISPYSNSLGDTIMVTYNVANIGGDTVFNYYIGWHISQDAIFDGEDDLNSNDLDSRMGNIYVRDTILPGDTVLYTSPVLVRKVFATGLYYFIGYVDTYNNLSEISNDNNTSAIPLYIDQVDCFVRIWPHSDSLPYSGGGVHISYDYGGPYVCPDYDITPTVSWLTNRPNWIGGSMNGGGYTSLTVRSNNTGNPRVGEWHIGSEIFTVYQEGCPIPPTHLPKDTLLSLQGDTIQLLPAHSYQDYLWQDGSTDSVFMVTDTGVYTLAVTDTLGCTRYDTINVRQDPCDFMEVQGFHTDVSCDIPDGEISISITGGVEPYTYSWEHGDTIRDVQNLPIGFYKLYVYDSQNCEKTFETTLTHAINPHLSFHVTHDSCGRHEGEVQLAAHGGLGPYLYVWDDGLIASYRSNMASGNYSAQVVDDRGCRDTASIDVQLLDIAPIVNLGNDTLQCGDELIYLSPGAGFFSYHWSTGQNNPAINASNSGSYWVEVSNQSGCRTRDSINILPHAFSTNISISDNHCPDNPNGSLSLTSQGTLPIQYLWSTGDTAAIINALSAGPYVVQVTDSIGCTEVYAAHIVDDFPILALDLGLDQNLCDGDTIEIDPGVYGSYTWSDGDTNRIRTFTETVDIQLSVVDSADCGLTATDSLSLDFDVLQSSPSAIYSPRDIICEGDPLTLEVTGGLIDQTENWVWYESNCGGAVIGYGATIEVAPLYTTTYVARVEARCDTTLCLYKTINVVNPDTLAGSWGEGGLDRTTAMARTPEGNWIMVGQSNSRRLDGDILVVKMDNTAHLEWYTFLDTSMISKANAVFVNAQGEIIIAGTAFNSSRNSMDGRIIKLDSVGDIIWSRFYGGTGTDRFNAIAEYTTNQYLLVGYTDSYGVGGDAWVAKIDDSGTLLSSYNFGNNSLEEANALYQIDSQKLLIVGRAYNPSNFSMDMFALKIDTTGLEYWSALYGNGDSDIGYDMIQDSNGDFLLLGTSVGASSSNMSLTRVDTNGSFISTQQPLAHLNLRGYSMQADSTGNIFCLGDITDSNGNIDIALLKTDGQGQPIWYQTYGGQQFERGITIQPKTSSGWAIGGITSSQGMGQEDFYLFMVDQDGQVIHNTCIPYTEPCPRDIFEPNESAWDAKDFPLIGVLRNASICPVSDNDFYRYKVGSKNHLRISLGENDIDGSIQVFNQAFILVGQTDSSENREKELVYAGIEGEKLFIRVFSPTQKINKDSYTLRIQERASPWNQPQNMNHNLDTLLPDVISFNVFPNPANHNVNIEINSPTSGVAIIKLFDMLGRQKQVYYKSVDCGSDLFQVETNGFGSGAYLLHISLNGYNDYRQLIIQNE